MNKREISAADIIGVVFTVIGVLFAGIGGACQLNIEKIANSPSAQGDVRILPVVFGGIGVVFLAIGLIFVGFTVRKRKTKAALLERGILHRGTGCGYPPGLQRSGQWQKSIFSGMSL